MTTTLQNSIWPNDDGNLGKIKVQIPDGVNVQWPEGDALLGNCVYQNGKLVGFVDTKALTVNSSGSTTINYDYVNIELPFAEDAMTINRGPRSKYLFIKFNDKEVEEGGNVIVTLKYKGCKTVDDVKAVDPNYLTTDIIDGVWSEGLGDLEDGAYMFGHSGAFTDDELISFKSDLSKLINGYEMFSGNVNLVTFESDLPNLENGTNMFYMCELDLASVERIAESLPLAKEGNNSNIDLGGGFTNAITTYARPELPVIPVVKDEFKLAISKIINKGWNVYSNLKQVSLDD